MNSSFLSRTAAVLALLAGATTLTLSSGCLAVAAGAGAAGAVAYVRGDLASSVDAGIDHADQATNRALEQLQFAKISESKDAMTGDIVARTAEDKKIQIHLERASETLTKIKIRVGLIGDEQLSLLILDKIKANL